MSADIKWGPAEVHSALYGYRTQPARDDRFFSLVQAIAAATADRCQAGLLNPEDYGKEVVGMASFVMAEFLYATGERQRPWTDEEREKFMRQFSEGVK